MKTLTEILQTRRSTRKFDGRKPGREVMQGLLDRTFMAPSSKNTRSTRFVVVDDAEKLAKMALMRDFGSAFLAEAPCAVVVCGDAEATDLWLDNAAISATILQLAAVENGLASCWVHINGRPRKADSQETAEDYLRTFLPLPTGWKPLCAIALGYGAEPERPRTPRDNADKVIWA